MANLNKELQRLREALDKQNRDEISAAASAVVVAVPRLTGGYFQGTTQSELIQASSAMEYAMKGFDKLPMDNAQMIQAKHSLGQAKSSIDRKVDEIGNYNMHKNLEKFDRHGRLVSSVQFIPAAHIKERDIKREKHEKDMAPLNKAAQGFWEEVVKAKETPSANSLDHIKRGAEAMGAQAERFTRVLQEDFTKTKQKAENGSYHRDTAWQLYGEQSERLIDLEFSLGRASEKLAGLVGNPGFKETKAYVDEQIAKSKDLRKEITTHCVAQYPEKPWTEQTKARVGIKNDEKVEVKAEAKAEEKAEAKREEKVEAKREGATPESKRGEESAPKKESKEESEARDIEVRENTAPRPGR